MPYSEGEIEQALLDLVQLGLVSVEYDENLKPLFRITDEGKFQLFIDDLNGMNPDV